MTKAYVLYPFGRGANVLPFLSFRIRAMRAVSPHPDACEGVFPACPERCGRGSLLYLCFEWKATPTPFGPQWLPAVGLVQTISMFRFPKRSQIMLSSSSASSGASV